MRFGEVREKLRSTKLAVQIAHPYSPQHFLGRLESGVYFPEKPAKRLGFAPNNMVKIGS
jgi:hypothetical protein